MSLNPRAPRFNAKARQQPEDKKKEKGQRFLSNRQVRILERKLERKARNQELTELLAKASASKLDQEDAAKLTKTTWLSQSRKLLKKQQKRAEPLDPSKRAKVAGSGTEDAAPALDVEEDDDDNADEKSATAPPQGKNTRETSNGHNRASNNDNIDSSDDSDVDEEDMAFVERLQHGSIVIPKTGVSSVAKWEKGARAKNTRSSNSNDDSDSDSDGESDNGAARERRQPRSQSEIVSDLHLDNLKRSVVHVKRDASIAAARLSLPVVREEHDIMDAINHNNVVIICGSTGSGKTTQVPQFLYEAGFNKGYGGQDLLIGVTEPRRIAAISVAKRVAEELALTSRDVSHHVRYDNATTTNTKIKFMTDGVLQKEIEQDFALRRYSCLVIDEAHERSVHTDIVLGLLSRIIPLREKMFKDTLKLYGKESAKVVAPLKLIIMSATLRVTDFTENKKLFPNTHIPIIKVESRQHKVTVHFSKSTRVDQDPITYTAKMVSKIHRRLPDGGILVFMTGQAEILETCRKLRELFPTPLPGKGRGKKGGKKPGKKEASERGADKKTREPALSSARPVDESEDTAPPSSQREETYDTLEDQECNLVIASTEDMGGLSDDEDGSDGDGDANGEDDKPSTASSFDPSNPDDWKPFGDPNLPLHVIPLFSNLSSKAQAKVFANPPAGHRLCVVATNVAETSITIPNISYVVDTGLVKRAVFDPQTGATEFKIEWISKASGSQRAGRAGRTGPGHCFRLFTSAVYNDFFPQFSPPEILELPTDGLILQMKAMGIEKVVNFPFPTPPKRDALVAGLKSLKVINALDSQGNITNIGKTIARFPVAPRYGKMLALAKHYGCSDSVVALVAALTVKNILLTHGPGHGSGGDDDEHDDDEEEEGVDKGNATSGGQKQVRLSQWKHFGLQKRTDFATFLAVLGACDHELEKSADIDAFCAAQLIRSKAIRETRKLREQLVAFGQTAAVDVAEDADKEPKAKGIHPLPYLDDTALSKLRQIALAAFPDQVAMRVNKPSSSQSKLIPYKCAALDGHVYIHPSSALAGISPPFVVYHRITTSKTRKYMREVSEVSRGWIPKLAAAFCTQSAPLDEPRPRYDPQTGQMKCFVTSAYGPHMWEMPVQEVGFPECPEKYKHFARALLNGEVLACLKPFVPKLLNKPDIVLKAWSKDRIVRLMRALVNGKVASKPALLAMLRKDESYLLGPLSAWLDSAEHPLLRAAWANALGAEKQ